MEPISAAIIAGGTLISGLMGTAAQREELRKKKIADAEARAFEAQNQGIGNLAKNDQHAFEQLMQGYRSALIG